MDDTSILPGSLEGRSKVGMTSMRRLGGETQFVRVERVLATASRSRHLAIVAGLDEGQEWGRHQDIIVPFQQSLRTAYKCQDRPDKGFPFLQRISIVRQSQAVMGLFSRRSNNTAAGGYDYAEPNGHQHHGDPDRTIGTDGVARDNYRSGSGSSRDRDRDRDQPLGIDDGRVRGDENPSHSRFGMSRNEKRTSRSSAGGRGNGDVAGQEGLQRAHDKLAAAQLVRLLSLEAMWCTRR